MSKQPSWDRQHHRNRQHKSRGGGASSHAANGSGENVGIQLLAFGYGCKLFKDEPKALHVEQGRHLIPWMGDESLLIDRFDVRGYLTAPELKKYESSLDRHDDQDEEISREERLLDRERYRDMQTEKEEENGMSEAIDSHEKTCDEIDQPADTIKHLNAIGFDYSKLESQSNSRIGGDFGNGKARFKFKEEFEKEDFVIPAGLKLPEDIVQPKSMRMHNLIEKTAKFISSQGTQMEIILKTKQSNNSQFDFLRYDCPLNSYYKCLVEQIKRGKFVPKENLDDDQDDHKEEPMIESDNDSDSDYLHPSLKASLSTNQGDKNLIQVPATLRSQNENSAYSKLVRSLQNHMANETKKEPTIICGQAVKYIKVQNDLEMGLNETKEEERKVSFRRNSLTRPVDNSIKTVSGQSTSTDLNQIWVSNSTLSIPPPEIETIIDKLAQYVSKNGESFEQSIRDRNEGRFNFLNTGHEYYAFYVNRRNHYQQEKQRLQKEEEERKEQAARLEQQNQLKSNYSRRAMEAQKEKLAALKLELLNRKRAVDQNEGEIELKKERDEAEEEDEEIRLKLEKMKQKKEMNRKKEEEKKKEEKGKKLSTKKSQKLDNSLKEKQEERKRKAAFFLSMLKKSDMIANSSESNGQEPRNSSEKNELKEDSPHTVVKKESPNNNLDDPNPVASPKLICAVRQPVMIDFSELPKLNSHLPFFASDKDLIKDRHLTPSPKTERSRRSYRSNRSAYDGRSLSRSLSPEPRRRSRDKDKVRSRGGTPSAERHRKRRQSRSNSRSRSRSRSRSARKNSDRREINRRRRSRSRSHSKHSSSTKPRRRSRSSSRHRSYRSSSKSRRSPSLRDHTSKHDRRRLSKSKS